MDEITISRDDLAHDLRIRLRVVRQKKPHLLIARALERTQDAVAARARLLGVTISR